MVYDQSQTTMVWYKFLDQIAQHLPEKTAVFTDDGALTYQQLADRSIALANEMLASGIQRGDRIALLLPNSLVLVTALIAASRIGAIFCILHPDLKTYHLEHILADAQPKLLITTCGRAQEADLQIFSGTLWYEERLAERRVHKASAPYFPGISQDPACLIYTSGSTGKPKAVIASHSNIIFAARAIQYRLQYQEDDVVGTFLPFSFDVGLYQLFLTLQAGATLALGRDTHVGPGFIKKLLDWQVSVLPAVPSLASALIRLGKRTAQQLPKLRILTSTGAHFPHASIAELQTLFPACNIFVMFGLTECKRVSILSPTEYLSKPDSLGKPLPDTECLIVSSEGNVLPPGKEGELVVRGSHVMLGYWSAPELTAKRFRLWGSGQERVLFTGDTCMIDEDGYLYFRGRSDDIYKQGGYRISTLEIEAAASDMPQVYLAAVLTPTEETGAILFVTGNLTEQSLFTGLRKRLEDYKLPPHMRILSEMPLTSNGKIDKKQLKSLFSHEVVE